MYDELFKKDEHIFEQMLQIHQLIEIERDKAGYTQESMAEKLGIKRSTYQYWEQNTPSIDKIRLVCQALNLPDDYFFVKVAEQNNAAIDKLEASAQLLIKSYQNIIAIQDKLITTQAAMIKKIEDDAATESESKLDMVLESLK